jgi:hypothetical protein
VKVVISPWLSRGFDRRYVVIDETTGEVLDDAQGYGYKTAQNAYRVHVYKPALPEKKAQRNAVKCRVERWCAEHPAFMSDVEQAAFYAMKDGESFTKADVEQLSLLRKHSGLHDHLICG